MRRSLALAAVFLVLATPRTSAPFTRAAAAGDASDSNLAVQTQAIAARLRCPVCQNESVADSPAELAAQMRGLIRQKLEAGETPDQITAYFVGRYGEWILLEPPRRGLLWVVWLAPLGTLAAGFLIALAFLRGATKRGARG